jgi:hypothetical protein
VVSFTSRPLNPQGNSPWYPLVRRLGGHISAAMKRFNSTQCYWNLHFSLNANSFRTIRSSIYATEAYSRCRQLRISSCAHWSPSQAAG